jgi:protein-S-isoprenylcysteine O-methyltransferase Ste14
MAVAGLVLGTGAIAALGRELTPYPQPRQGASLVARGPYGLARHPIYGSIVLGFVGVSMLFGSASAGIAALGIAGFFRAKSGVEERALTIGIPGYSEYLRSVRKRFIPYVW